MTYPIRLKEITCSGNFLTFRPKNANYALLARQKLIHIFVFAIGLCIGSFLNVCIYRLPRNQSILHPPSHCPNCQNSLKWYDNIPLLSYSLLKGRCRNCQIPISARYPLVEILTGILFLLSFLHHPIGLSFLSFLLLLKNLVFISLLLPIFFIDLDKQIIPNSLSYMIIVTGLIFGGLTGSLLPNLVGAMIGGALFMTIRLLGSFFLKEEAMGMGDIKLATGIGAFLAWKVGLISFFISFLLGAVIVIILLLTHLKKKKDKIPFAPFLIGATLISLFLGDKLLYLYLNFIYY